jgi:hypothetical protein
LPERAEKRPFVPIDLYENRSQRPVDYLNLRVLGYQQYIPSIEEIEQAMQSIDQMVGLFNQMFPIINVLYRYLSERGKKTILSYGIVDAMDEWLIAFADNTWKTCQPLFFAAETQARMMHLLSLRNQLINNAAKIDEAIILSWN